MSTEKLKKLAKRSAFISAWVLAASTFVVVFGSSIANQRVKFCNDIQIHIDHDTGLYFVDTKDVKEMILSYCGDSLPDMNIKDIDFSNMEISLEKNPYIENAEIYSNIKGTINVEIEQKEPLIRVVNNKGVSYYISKNGEKIPLSSKFTARVVVATGQVDTADNDRLFRLAQYIDKDEFWKAQFEQIYVNEDGEIELVPKMGNHFILIGEVERLAEKFEKLRIFYDEVIKNVDASDYRVINVKFKDQIVCTKI